MRSKRKEDHIKHALKHQNTQNLFSSITLEPLSLPTFNLSDVSLETTYLNHTFPYPIYINAMTGGSELSYEINKTLGVLAKKFNLMMACGSQQIALDEPEHIKSFAILRDMYPDGFIVGNVSANSDYASLQLASDMINANAMQIHINVAQELTMDEGDRDFSHWSHNIKENVEKYTKPVIVKEVGFGMSRASTQALKDLGVKYLDVSGKGGTNFIQIESERSTTKHFNYLEDWGLSTVDSLLANQEFMNDMEILASGGVTTPLDVVKCLVLGAKAVGMSKFFLELAQLDESQQYQILETFIEDIKKIMLMVGAKDIDSLRKVRYIYEK